MSIIDISYLISHDSPLSQVMQSAAPQIDLFTIYKICALVVSGSVIAQQTFSLAVVFVNSKTGKATDIEVFFNFVQLLVTALFQIPYIELGLEDNIVEFSNYRLGQIVILLDILGRIMTQGIFFILLADSTDWLSFIISNMALFRSFGYFVVAYNYMQWSCESTIQIFHMLYSTDSFYFWINLSVSYA